VAETTGEQQRLQEAARSFEALFIAQLLGEMRGAQSSPGEGLLDGGVAEAVYQGELDWELAQKLAVRGPFGLATALQTQLGDAARLRPK